MQGTSVNSRECVKVDWFSDDESEAVHADICWQRGNNGDNEPPQTLWKIANC